MSLLIRRLSSLVAITGMALLLAGCGMFGGNQKADVPLKRETLAALGEMGSGAGQPMLVRIYKQSSELEVWKRTNSGVYRKFRTYEICAWSGELGPKIKEGDRQSPEGFYTITPALMNPNSSYHLSFNTGFPNKFDRALGRTGSDLMVHGDCSSRGCYAMTNEQIKEIYALARESFKGGNKSFALEIYPFRMTEANLTQHAGSPHISYWKNLKQGADVLAAAGQPAKWDVCDRRYVFNVAAADGTPLDALSACPALVATGPLGTVDASTTVASAVPAAPHG